MVKHIFFALFVFLLVACNDNPKPHVYSGNALGTTFSIQFFSDEELELSSQIDSTFTVLNNSLSTYISTSDISKINQGDTSVVVDQQFVDNFNASKKIYQETNGIFDPSVGLLVNAYGFGPVNYNLDISNPTILDSLMQYVGFDKIHLNESNQLEFTPGIFLDFNAIAKGYSVDRLASLLEDKGVTNFLVEVGGELVGKGLNLATNSTWRVGIDDPNENTSERSFSTIIELDGYGMATSGNYRKYSVDLNGNKFVHTINPKTGLSTKSDVLSATVIAKTCMEADAYATAFMAMGSEQSIEFITNKKDIFALLYIAESEEIKIYTSEGFDSFLVD